MASGRRWLRRSADDEGDESGTPEPPETPGTPETHDTPDELTAPKTPEPPPEDPARTPLVQARHDRLVAAAGIDPSRDLGDHGRAVLDWLARQDDATCSGVVELLQATSVAAVRTA